MKINFCFVNHIEAIQAKPAPPEPGRGSTDYTHTTV